MMYRVMAKAKHHKRFQCYGTHDEARFAENSAVNLANGIWSKAVKVICIDDNGIKNEIWYERRNKT